jgi:hypothetical protein
MIYAFSENRRSAALDCQIRLPTTTTEFVGFGNANELSLLIGDL